MPKDKKTSPLKDMAKENSNDADLGAAFRKMCK